MGSLVETQKLQNTGIGSKLGKCEPLHPPLNYIVAFKRLFLVFIIPNSRTVDFIGCGFFNSPLSGNNEVRFQFQKLYSIFIA